VTGLAARGLGAALWFMCPASAGTLEADEIRVSPDQLAAEGAVSLTFPGHRLEAASIRLTQLPTGQVSIEAEQIAWTPCTCTKAPWSVSAKTGEGTVGETIVLKSGAFRVCGVPIVPVPYARIPMDPRAPRLLLPEVRYGDTGAAVGLPVWLPLGDRSQVVLTPEIWADRGFRQRIAVDGPLGEVRLSAIKDDALGRGRGTADIDVSHDRGEIWTGADIQWSSDSGVRDDYAGDFFERTRPFEERRLVLGMGPFRLESNTFDDAEIERPVGAVVSLVGVPFGPMSVGAIARVDAFSVGDQQAELQRSGVGLSMDGGWAVGSLDAEISADFEAVQVSSMAPFAQAGLRSALFLPTWGKILSMRHLSQTGIETRVAASDGTLWDPGQWIRPSPKYAVGPVHRATLLSATGVPLHFSAEAMRVPDAWAPSAAIWLDRRGFIGAAQFDLDLQSVTLGFSDEGLNIRAGVVRGPGVLAGAGAASVLVAPGWRPGWSGLYDLPTSRFVRQGPSLDWDSGCDCMRVHLGVEWAQDRQRPDAMIRIDLQPRRTKDR
jgi:hypothetical protein